MKRKLIYDSLHEAFYEELCRNNMNLLWHLKEITRDLPAKHILDVGSGMSVSKNICLLPSAETVLIVDPERWALDALID